MKKSKQFERAKLLPFYEHELILANILNKSREFVLTHPDFSLTLAQKTRLKSLIKRRLKGEPLAYILGHKEFYGLDFFVDKNVLVPRPETELMIDEVLELIKNHSLTKTTILDIGTGSGCVIITLAKSLTSESLNTKPNINFLASDISKSALRMAKKNSRRHGMKKTIFFKQGNLFEPFLKKKITKPALIQNHLIITANLPYLTPAQVSNSPSIRFEPKLALVAGNDGLKYYRELLGQLKTFRADQTNNQVLTITLFMEIDPCQKLKIKSLVKNFFPKASVDIKKDLRGHSRLAIVDV